MPRPSPIEVQHVIFRRNAASRKAKAQANSFMAAINEANDSCIAAKRADESKELAAEAKAEGWEFINETDEDEWEVITRSKDLA